MFKAFSGSQNDSDLKKRNYSSDKIKVIVTLVEDFDDDKDSLSESHFEVDLPVNTPFHYVVRFACE